MDKKIKPTKRKKPPMKISAKGDSDMENQLKAKKMNQPVGTATVRK
jgi:hypothetical protein